MKNFAFDKVENIVGKTENAAFSPFPAMFSKAVFSREDESRHCVINSCMKWKTDFEREGAINYVSHMISYSINVFKINVVC